MISRWVHAWVIPEQIAIGRAWQAFDDHGQIQNEKLNKRFDAFARSLVENTCKLRGISMPTAIHISRCGDRLSRNRLNYVVEP